jgi:hypothetical protein
MDTTGNEDRKEKGHNEDKNNNNSEDDKNEKKKSKSNDGGDADTTNVRNTGLKSKFSTRSNDRCSKGNNNNIKNNDDDRKIKNTEMTVDDGRKVVTENDCINDVDTIKRGPAFRSRRRRTDRVGKCAGCPDDDDDDEDNEDNRNGNNNHRSASAPGAIRVDGSGASSNVTVDVDHDDSCLELVKDETQIMSTTNLVHATSASAAASAGRNDTEAVVSAARCYRRRTVRGRISTTDERKHGGSHRSTK